MCIALLSTAHPAYKLILIDNRDEYLDRPTASATWWPDNENVLAGRDLLRDVHGTWLGVTKTGKIAVLTNFREQTQPSLSAVSRGVIIRNWLSDDVGSTEDFIRHVVDTGLGQDAGGFSLVCGHVGEKLAIISNRAQDQSQVPWICGDIVQTIGLSNANFADRTWKKVLDGEEFMLDVIRSSVQDNESEDKLVERFLDLLSTDTLERPVTGEEEGLATYIRKLRTTIFVPALGKTELPMLPSDEWAAARKMDKAVVLDGTFENAKQLGVSGLYGTQKQTVVLIDHDMNVRFFERTLFDGAPSRIPKGEGDVDIRFQIKA